MKHKRTAAISVVVVALFVAMLVMPLLASAGQQFNTYTGTLTITQGTLDAGPDNVRVSVDGWAGPQYGTADSGIYGMTVQGDDNTDLGKDLTFEVKIDGNWVQADAVCVDCVGATPQFVDTGAAQVIDLTAPGGGPVIPQVAFTQANYEIAEGGMVTVGVVLSGTTTNPVMVQYQTQDGTAAAPGDYTAQSGTLTFNPGEDNQTFQVQTIQDAVYEPGGEIFNVVLMNPNNAVLGAQNPAQVTILDDDPPPPMPEVSFVGADLYQPEEGNAQTVTVILSSASTDVVTVQWATTDVDGAVGGVDYTTANGTVTFNPGQVNRTFQVNTIEDAFLENDEQFGVVLQNPVNATLGDPAQKTITILDDDVADTDWTFGAAGVPLIAPYPNNGRIILGADVDIDQGVRYEGDWFQVLKYDEQDDVPGHEWLTYVSGFANDGPGNFTMLEAGEYYYVVVSDENEPLQLDW